MKDKAYAKIVAHYESCVEKHGDSCQGVGWPRSEEMKTRFDIMLDVIRGNTSKDIRLLDFGCGTAHLFEHIQKKKRKNIDYIGLDISPKFIEMARAKYPNLDFLCLDVLVESSSLPEFDYAVMNGVFTQKRDLSFNEMFSYFKDTVRVVFRHAKEGIAFNVMSKNVDWEKDGNFYLPMDALAAFISSQLSRNFVIRHDYGLYEYTTYVYKGEKCK